MFEIRNITRKNIIKMKPYSSARNEYNGKAKIWLDANENPNKSNSNRYPDPLQLDLKMKLAQLKKVNPDQIFIGNGSDEAIDLLFRAFCEPQLDRAFIFPPTYGMYKVYADINNIEIVSLPLQDDFSLPTINVIKSQIQSTGLLFVCAPNNPTGTMVNKQKLKKLANLFYGLIVVDEAYIDFSEEESAISLLDEIPNLVVLQTFSKAWGMAGMRVGMAFANEEIIAILNKIKPPYNINSQSQKEVLSALNNPKMVQNQIKIIKKERAKLIKELNLLKVVIQIFPSEANFILVKFKNANRVYKHLLNNGIVVRNRCSEIKETLRITIGSPLENQVLLNVLKKY